MFQERNQWGSDWSNLLRWYVHQFNLWRRNYRIISILTTLNFVANEWTVIVQGGITLTNYLAFFLFCWEINNVIIIHVNHRVLYLTIGSFDEAKVINLCVNAEWRNQTNVRAFRWLNRTKTTIVRIVYVTHLETSTFTWQTARTKGWKTTFVRYLSQGVCLVHELWQGIRTKEWIDYAWNSLSINQVSRSEYFIVTNVHTLTNGAAHTCQTNSKLVRKLLTNGAYTTVAQVVNIINRCLRVDQLN